LSAPPHLPQTGETAHPDPRRETSSIDAVHDTLRAVFGFDTLRTMQAPILEAVLGGRDVLAVLPTGGGKSLCYQLPAVHKGGLVVVVSPLIALMREQVASLSAMGIPAACLTSANDWTETRRILDAVRRSEIRLLYLAPERLARADTLDLLVAAKPWLLAVDEAHCVVEWGHDFRPEYREIPRLTARLPSLQTIALTATADAATRADILAHLFATQPEVFVAEFDRPNLSLTMAPKLNARRQILELAERHRGDSGIVYCSSRAKTAQVAEWLTTAGLTAVSYHAGMATPAREAAQDRFLREDGVIVCATIAFGMGIDKPDVRFVAHADMPKTIESYWQEIGRAGRDGEPADTLTLYGLDDIVLRRRQIEDGDADEARKRIDRQRLNALVGLCESPRCRRQTLLAYFGETSEPCGNCDLCRDPPRRTDGTTAARKALSAMVRTGERFGAEHVIAVLRGEPTARISELGHDRLPTFGVGTEHGASQWRSILRQLAAAGHIVPDIAGYGGLGLTKSGWTLLRGTITFEMREDIAVSAASGKRKAKSGATAAETSVNQSLLDALKAKRRELAAGLPLYAIFSNRTLVDMADRAPASLAEMRNIHGVGDVKLVRYGAAFLAVINAWRLSGDS
jgi:ATP-dependent DNA helicase RecQ